MSYTTPQHIPKFEILQKNFFVNYFFKYPIESCQKWSVDKVCKDDEGVRLFKVEEKDGSDEGHALHVAKVRSVADVSTQQVPQCCVVRTTLLKSGLDAG